MFITTNVRERRKIFLDPAYAREAIDVLYRVQELHPFLLYGFVIMPDHCHLLLKVPAPNTISKVMDRWKMGVSHSLSIGSIWQRRFNLKIPDTLSPVLQYIHANPIKAGIVLDSSLYPWSSASGKWDVTPLPMEL